MSRIFSAKIVLSVLLLLVLECSVLPNLGAGVFQPRLLYLLILYAAYEWHGWHALSVAGIAGFAQDALSSGPFGAQTVTLILLGVALNLTVRKIERGSWLLRSAVTFAFVLLAQLTGLLLSGMVRESFVISWYLLGLMFGAAIATTLLLPLFFALASRTFGDRPFLKQYELFR